MKIMVYSHDAFGLGNIRRMLSICEHLLANIIDVSILVVSGSPMLHSFRLPQGLDYIKLPCLNRGESGSLAVKYLGTDFDLTVKLRSDLILSAATNFQPDVLLVDKKPYGIAGELKDTVQYLRSHQPGAKLVLLLRDILDRPEVVIADWDKHDSQAAIEDYYDQVLVVGMPEVFDIVREYQFSPGVASKVQFCGYIGRLPGLKSPARIRQELGLLPQQRLVLVTPGGGEDGYATIATYLQGLALLTNAAQFKTLIFTGPEMPGEQRETLMAMAQEFDQVILEEFSDDMMSYMAVADTVVAMGGYNTICEILAADKPAVIIPRIKPAQEQLMRSARMQRLGLFKAIHPDQLTPARLMRSVLHQLHQDALKPALKLDLDALPRINKHLLRLTRTTMQAQLESQIAASQANGLHTNVTYLTQKLESMLCLTPTSSLTPTASLNSIARTLPNHCDRLPIAQ
jgi:predicted glycosyltransferase